MNASKKTQDAFYYLVGLCAIIFYGTVIYQHAYNIPKWDDFPAILRFLDHWLAASTVAEKTSALFAQTNEHILLVNHLAVLLQYYLVGHLNFAWLIYLGNAFYVGSALALWLFFKDHAERAFCFAIIMLCMVNFYTYDSTLWAMTAISNQAVICFSLLAIYNATLPKKNLLWPMLFASLAVFSQSNGLLVLLAILVFFYLDKDWLNLRRWIIFSALLGGVYAYCYHSDSLPDESFLSVLPQIPASNYFLTIPAFVAYFGANIFTQTSHVAMVISLLLGTAIIMVTLRQIQGKQFSKPLLVVMLFLASSIFSVVAYRGLVAGPQIIYVSRYKMYGACFLIAGVFLSPLVIKKWQTSRRWRIGVLLASVLYFAWSFPANLAQARVIDGDLFRSMQYWVEDGDFRRARGFLVPDADSYLFAALANKTYTPMVLLPEENQITQVKTLSACPVTGDATVPVTASIALSHKNPNAAGIKITHIANDSNATVSVSLCTEQPLQETAQQLSYEFTLNSLKQSPQESVYFIERGKILPGTYAVWVKMAGQFYRVEKPFLNKPATR